MPKTNNFVELINEMRNLKPEEVGEFAFTQAMKIINCESKPLLKKLAEKIYTHPEFLSDVSYHNHNHSAEATLAAAFLLSFEYDKDDPVQKEKLNGYGPYLILGMLAHDLGHPGRVNASFMELEWSSMHRVEEIIDNLREDLLEEGKTQSATVLEEIAPILREIILHTEFTKSPAQNYNAYFSSVQLPKELSKLKVLANEADVLAAMLTVTGPDRGRALANEWNNKATGTYKGRLGFLKMLESQGYYATKASQNIGLKEHLVAQIGAIESLGVDYLDSLVPAAADMFVFNKAIEIAPNPLLFNNKESLSNKLKELKNNGNNLSPN